MLVELSSLAAFGTNPRIVKLMQPNHDTLYFV